MPPLICKPHILALEDNEFDAELLKIALRDFGAELTIVKRRGGFEEAVQSQAVSLIISDYTLPGYDGLSALEFASKHKPDVPFIFFSGTIGEETAVEALQRGASDYVLKSRPARLKVAVERALNDAWLRREKRQHEDRLRLQSAALEAAANGILITDRDGVIVWANPAIARLTGFPIKEILGKTPRLFKSGEHDAMFYQKLWSTVSAGEVWQGEIVNRRKDGALRHEHMTITPVRDPNGSTNHFVVVREDCTESKQLERQFLQAQRMESLGALASGIAHDLNNVLAPIVMAADLMQRREVPDDQRQRLAVVRRSAERGSEMVKQILSFARGVSGQPSHVQLNTVVCEIARLVKQTFPRNVTIELHLQPDLPPISGNETQIHQILLNLCINARDAMSKGGQLTLRTEVRQRMASPAELVVISVTDTGEGMSAEVRNRIFEPFFTTKPQGKGTGLGLSTVQMIMKHHQGFVDVDSEPGRGTTFDVCFPSVGAIPAANTAQTSTQHPSGNGEEILVVDDEVAMLEIMRESLSSFNYQVLAAKNGLEAIELYQQRRHKIALVITDMMMPLMDGAEVILALRKINPGVKVICVSGLGSEASLAKAQYLEVKAVLKKPYSIETLLGTLRSVLNRPGI